MILEAESMGVNLKDLQTVELLEMMKKGEHDRSQTFETSSIKADSKCKGVLPAALNHHFFASMAIVSGTLIVGCIFAHLKE